VPEPYLPEPYAPETYVPETTAFAPEPEQLLHHEPEPDVVPEANAPIRMRPRSIAIDEIDRLSKELGLSLKYGSGSPEPEAVTPAAADEGDVFDFGAALDRARNAASGRRSVEISQSEVDAEAIREAAMAEARVTAEREAREAVAADMARVQAEAEAMREAAIAEAREAEAMREAAMAEARMIAEREAREAMAADMARVQAEAEAMREAAIAEAREAEAAREAAIAEARATAERQAREAVAADLARVQAQAEAMREAAIAEAREAEATREAAITEARAAAERAAREKLDAELARVREEAEVAVAAALTKVKAETEEAERVRAEEARLRAEEAERVRAEEVRLRAEEAERVRAEAEMARAEAERVRVEAQQAQEAFEAELARVRAEVEQSLAAQLETARKESERLRATEAAKARERAAAEAQLKAELDRLKFVATQARKADESEVRRATDQIKQLEGELARVHAQAEERQEAQLKELRAQMAEMREAAAHQARAAAAEALASEVARATAHTHESSPRRLNVVRMQPRVAAQGTSHREVAAPEVETAEEFAQPAAPHRTSADYYSLFQPPVTSVEEPEPEEESASWREWTAWAAEIDYKRHAKWALPIAACLLLVTNINMGNSISAVTSFVTPEVKPKQVVKRVNPDPFIEVVEQRVGSLKIESTPDGAEAILDGKKYGKTPLTIPDLEAGMHTLVLKSSAGTITRRVTIKNNQTTLLSEAIFSGWLAIFSQIPITVVLDGNPVNLTDDGRVMAAPGQHVVELVSDRFAYRATETLEVRPGETTAHTLNLPMGTVRVHAPDGAEIKVDGSVASGSASDGLSVAIGSHEISAIHPSMGERRASVDVRHGEAAEVTLRFE
jgi:hypothetical protein